MTTPRQPGASRRTPPKPPGERPLAAGEGPQAPQLTTAARQAVPSQTRVQPRQKQPPAPFRAPTMRPPALSRGEQILFWSLLAAVLLMSFLLVRLRNRTAAHFLARVQAVPLASAAGAPASVILALANDTTGALTERPLAFPLPADPNTRSRVVLEKLLAEYTAPGSAHPLQPGPPGTESVHEVFLTPLPTTRGLLAVVDLSEPFAHTHPSGIEPESLTILSMIATLHANLPQIAEVRFLVDGEPRATLAGHAALDQTFLAGATEMAPSEAFTSGIRP